MSSVTNLVDLSIELLNSAKESSDVKKKLYFLEQLKEIVLFRDLSILVGLIPDIEEFKVERSIKIKKWLIKFFSAAFLKSKLVCSHLLSLYSFYILDETADELVKCIATEFRIIYAQMVSYIVKLPVQNKPTDIDAKTMWNQLNSIVTVLLDSITTSQNETTRIESIKFTESVVPYGTPLLETSKVLDPRLKAKKVETAVSSEITSNDIPLHHPFINRSEIEKNALLLFTKLINWIDDNNFNANLLCQLCQSVIAISLLRPNKYLAEAANKMLIAMQNKDLILTMPILGRQEFIKSVYKMRHSLAFQTDTKSLVAQFRSTVETLESLSNASTSTTTSLTTDDEEKQEETELLLSAKQALSVAETNIQQHKASIQGSSSGNASTSTDVDNTILKFSIIGETELSPIIYDKYIDTSKPGSLIIGNIQSVNGQFKINPTPCATDIHSNFAISSVFRIITEIDLKNDPKLVQVGLL